MRQIPDGGTLFNSNQSRLGAESDSITSQLIWTADDLGYDANQSVTLGDGLLLTDTLSWFINTFLIGATLRATDSRFKETPGNQKIVVKLSLLSLSTLMNNTNNNHGDHCIIGVNTAPGRPANTTGNQILDSTLCPEIDKGIRPHAVDFKAVPRI